jgi:IS605 OrfB family transposase
MQKTLKLLADVQNIPFQMEFSAIFRYAYERWSEKYSEPMIRWLVKNRWPEINCWLSQNAILVARQEYKAHEAQIKTGQRKKKVVWGGSDARKKYLNKEITKEEYKKTRLRPVILQGETNQDSNRSFDFSKLKDNILIYKPNKDTRIEYNFITGKNQDKEIEYLLNNIGKTPIQVLLKDDQICLTYEQEKELISTKIQDRILGIDMNPNYIGISIVDFKNNTETLVKAKCFRMSSGTRKDDEKRNYETIQIAHQIIKLAKHYRCSEIAIEELTMGATDAKKGRNFNRLCNNEWNRTSFQWIIKKLSDKNNIILKEVNCRYSSTIGNILHRNLPDPCAAGFEIARRGKFQYVKKLCMWPLVDFSQIEILNLWKKQGIDLTKSINWKALHLGLKNSKLKYRVSLDELASSVEDFCCKNTGVTIFSNFSIS